MDDGTPLTVDVTRAADARRPPVLLVHGWARSGDDFLPHARLLGAHRTVVVPHQRMHGASLLGPGPATTMPLLMQDLVTVLDRWEIDRVVAVGHSLGGLAVTLLADAHPDRVLATVAADPAYGADAAEIADAPRRRAAHLDAARRAYRERGDDPSLEAVHLRALGELYDSEYLLDHSVGAAPATAPLLARRRVPATVLYSTTRAAETERELSAGAPIEPRVVVWPGSGHLAAIERPAELCDLVDAAWPDGGSDDPARRSASPGTTATDG